VSAVAEFKLRIAYGAELDGLPREQLLITAGVSRRFDGDFQPTACAGKLRAEVQFDADHAICNGDARTRQRPDCRPAGINREQTKLEIVIRCRRQRVGKQFALIGELRRLCQCSVRTQKEQARAVKAVCLKIE
jgi:hypothetical protein